MMICRFTQANIYFKNNCMNKKMNEKNQISQFLIKAFIKENVNISMEEAKVVVSYPLPQSIKQILNKKINNHKKNGIYEYELINKIHNHFLLELVQFFELNPISQNKSNLKKDSVTKNDSKYIQEGEFEKNIANHTLKRLGYIK